MESPAGQKARRPFPKWLITCRGRPFDLDSGFSRLATDLVLLGMLAETFFFR